MLKNRIWTLTQGLLLHMKALSRIILDSWVYYAVFEMAAALSSLAAGQQWEVPHRTPHWLVRRYENPEGREIRRWALSGGWILRLRIPKPRVSNHAYDPNRKKWEIAPSHTEVAIPIAIGLRFLNQCEMTARPGTNVMPAANPNPNPCDKKTWTTMISTHDFRVRILQD